MLHYFVGIRAYREEAPERRRDCDLLLVQGTPDPMACELLNDREPGRIAHRRGASR